MRRSRIASRADWTIAVLVFTLAFAARWWWALGGQGAAFAPRPDVLEYVASAQSIVQSGTYHLQIGPHLVRPRYAPGWPLLLAAGLALGLAPQSLWAVAAVCGSTLAALLALIAKRTVERRASDAGRDAGEWPPAAAGAVAGAAWALAPVALSTGGTALSDEPAALLCGLGLLLSWSAFAGEEPAELRRRATLAAGGGLACGLLAAVRLPVATLLGVPLVMLVLGRRRFLRDHWREGVAWLCGAALVPVLVGLLLVRSDLDPWRWSDYTAWRSTQAREPMFDWRYAILGDADSTTERRASPHLRFAALVLLGVPGESEVAYLGYIWPAVGWLAGAGALMQALRRRRGRRLALALAAWTAATLCLYSSYFFSAARFYLPLLGFATVCAAVLLGEGLVRGGRGRSAAVLGLSAALLGQAVLLGHLDRKRLAAVDLRAAAKRVNKWVALDDDERRERTVPFDPVLAQAQGLLPPAVVSRIRDWGELPQTAQVKRMRAAGAIPPAKPHPPARKVS